MTALDGARRDAPGGASPHSPASLRMVWLNGRRVAADRPHLSAFDRGFTLADGVFETMRAYGGVAFRLDAHLARLARGAAALGIAAPGTEELRGWVEDALRAASSEEGTADVALRMTVTRGAGAIGVAPPTAGAAEAPTGVLTVQPVPRFPPALYAAGLSAHIASGVRNARAMAAGHKTLGYTDAVLALAEARRAGAEEALFLDGDGHCSEATSSNLFAWTGATLLTPPLSCGALPGITRAAVLELAGAAGIPTEERAFDALELLAAREAFLTSSLRELAPVVRVGGRAIGAGVPGPVTLRLTSDYAALVRRECAC